MMAWYLYPLLLRPARIQAHLDQIREAGLVDRTPNLWQLSLGVVRMQHRMLFRSDSVGTCSQPVRATWRARLLENRAVRLPFLLRERAIAPLNLSGLLSSPERVVRHLVGAHHDGNQFAYDLQMLAAHAGWLERVRDAAREVVETHTPRSRWLRDLCVFEGYHAALLAAAERAMAGDFSLPERDRDDPDVSFFAYLRWCAVQPETPAETWALVRTGRFSIEDGVVHTSPRSALTAAEVQSRSRAELAALLADGRRVRAADLAGFAYRGVSLGLPAAAERLTWKTFQKVFVSDGASVRGWNVRVEQRGVDAPSIPKRRRNAVVSFGHFHVIEPRSGRGGVELDYGAFAALLNPLRSLRDPIVAVNEGCPKLLLGRTLLQVGGARVPTPSFFTLEREGCVVS